MLAVALGATIGQTGPGRRWAVPRYLQTGTGFGQKQAAAAVAAPTVVKPTGANGWVAGHECFFFFLLIISIFFL